MPTLLFITHSICSTQVVSHSQVMCASRLTCLFYKNWVASGGSNTSPNFWLALTLFHPVNARVYSRCVGWSSVEWLSITVNWAWKDELAWSGFGSWTDFVTSEYSMIEKVMYWLESIYMRDFKKIIFMAYWIAIYVLRMRITWSYCFGLWSNQHG